MKEIKELDDMYLVLKLDDVKKRIDLDKKIQLENIRLTINNSRKKEGKQINNYLVLNLDDEIDIKSISHHLENLLHFPERFPDKIKVKDIAVDLVNAILKAKEKQ